jgi:hypothetical protein
LRGRARSTSGSAIPTRAAAAGRRRVRDYTAAPNSKEIAIHVPKLPTLSLVLAVLVADAKAQSLLSNYAGADLPSLSALPQLPDASLPYDGAPAAPATAAASDDDWRFTIAPFLWCASLDAKLRVGNLTTTASPSFDDLLKNLDLAGMAHLEAAKGRWMLFSDLVYMDLRSDDHGGPLGISSIDVRLQEYVGSLNLGYRVLDVPLDATHADGPRLRIDGYGGVRYTWYKATVNPFNGATQSDSLDWWDPLVGVRTTLVVTPKFNLVGRYDFGGWSVGSARTWFLFGGAEWMAFDSVAIGAGYAAFYQDYYGSNGFHLDQTVQGPVISLAFHF